MDRLPGLSAFMPALNEEGNLERMVSALRAALPQFAESYEIIIVNDGSRDGTGVLAQQLAQRYPEVRVIHHLRNLGYGAAVRTGLAACRYPWIFFTDGDCQFDVNDLHRLMPHASDYALVVGYREARRDPLWRQLNARGWNWLVRMLWGVRVRDVNCAFKLLRADVVLAMPLRASSALINAELLKYAARRGHALMEVPVRHFPRQRGTQTGGKPAVILKALWELAVLTVRGGQGS